MKLCHVNVISPCGDIAPNSREALQHYITLDDNSFLVTITFSIVLKLYSIYHIDHKTVPDFVDPLAKKEFYYNLLVKSLFSKVNIHFFYTTFWLNVVI